MGRGRPPKPGTGEERAAARRERVRNNVRALRERRRKETATLKAVSADHSRVRWLSDSTLLKSSPNNIDGSITDVDAVESSEVSSAQELDAAAGSLPLANRFAYPKILLPFSIDTKASYAFALLATMRQSFLPDSIHLPPAIGNANVRPWESKQYLWTPCAYWVTSAFKRASVQEVSVLKTCLLAIGVLLKSLEFQDTSLKVLALEMYRRALQGIRKSLEPLLKNNLQRPKDAVSLYLSCHAAAMFELMLSSDFSATMRHLRGVSQLVCHLGDGSDQEGQSIAWLLLQDYRFAEMGLCMKYRYTSFSSLKRQQFESNNLGQARCLNRPTTEHGHGSHNLLVKISDLADDISAIMVQLDSIRPLMHKPNIPDKIQRLLRDLNLIWDRFEGLHDCLITVYGTFLFRDISAEGPESGSMRFKTFDIGAAWCYNLMTQLHCLETSIDAVQLFLQLGKRSDSATLSPERLGTEEADEVNLGFADGPITLEKLHDLRRIQRAVCTQLTQCLHYFLQTDKGIIGQALAIFPLDAVVIMLAAERSRLFSDLSEAESAGQSNEMVYGIRQDMAKIVDAESFCRKMQDRARAFGLPSFAEIGGNFVESLHNDPILVGSVI
ncbi:hypothetical protein LTR05_006605 [Lithohypha guttulata]|uniref:Uncharacterized protein n=1 Tax=Lithohypha guttulata TaxID=1690604 RepID=A0AAN7SVJ5_9EURO|nr:hypothetical protein LTR05_006605 [Lithohypha guttulata]